MLSGIRQVRGMRSKPQGAKVAVLVVAFIASAAVLMATSGVYLAYRYLPPPRLLVRQHIDDPVLSQAIGVKPWVDDTGIDTSAWEPFGSEALGFWVRYPPGWYVMDCLAKKKKSWYPGVIFSSKPFSPDYCEQGSYSAGSHAIFIEQRLSQRPGEWPRTSEEKAFYREEFFSVRGQTILWLDVVSEARGEEGEELPHRPLRYWTSVNFQTIDTRGHYEISIGGRVAQDQLAAVFSSEQYRQLKALVGSLNWQ